METTITSAQDYTVEQRLRDSGAMTVRQAKSMTIGTNAEYEDAGRLLTEIKTRMKQVKEYWQAPKASAAAAHKTICERENEMLKPLSEAEKIIKKTMVDYLAAAEKARREAEEAARKRQQEEAERLLERAVAAEASGDTLGAETNMAMAQMVDEMRPASSVETPTAAGTGIRKTWKARITDAKAVPAYVNGVEIREIKMPALNNIAKMTNGELAIPGVEFYQESAVVMRAK